MTAREQPLGQLTRCLSADCVAGHLSHFATREPLEFNRTRVRLRANERERSIDEIPSLARLVPNGCDHEQGTA